MASVCISSCVDDTRVPVRATYVNLYKWPESDAAFVRSVSSNGRQNSNDISPQGGGRHHHHHHARVMDSISCRQMYLRSYTFSRKESMNEKTKKCIGRVKERVSRRSSSRRKPLSESFDGGGGGGRGGGGGGGGRRGKCVVVRRVKEVSCAAFSSIFRRLLSCTTKVDVVG